MTRDTDIREQEGLLRSVIDNSPIGIHLAKLDSNDELVLQSANRAADKIFGIDHSQFMKNSLKDILSEIDHSNIYPMYHRVARDGQTVQTESIRRNEQGNIRLAVEIRIFQISPGKVVAMFNDLTEQRRAEEALIESEIKYRSLFDLNPDGIVVHVDGKIMYANRKAMSLLGVVSPEDIVGRSPFDFIHPDYHKIVRERLETSRKQSEPTSPAEQVFLGFDGRSIKVEATSIPFSYGGKPGVQVVIRDLSVRKRTEEALQSSQTRFKNIVESSPMGIHMYRLEPDGRLVFMVANPAADKILGVDNTQFIGKTLEEAFPALANTEVPEKYRLAASKGIPWHTEQITYKDDQISGGFEVFAFQTSPNRMATMFLDVTERKRAENALLRERKAFRIIAESSLLFESTKDLCRHVLKGLFETLDFDFGTFRLYNNKKRSLEPVAVIGLDQATISEKVTAQSIQAPNLIAAHVARTKLGIFAPDTSKHEISSTFRERIDELNIRSLISWPILGGEDELIGIMQFGSHTPKVLTLEDESFFSTIAGMFSTVLLRNKTQLALRESEVRFRNLTETTSDWVWEINERLDYTYVSPRITDVLGYDPEEVLGKTPYDFMPDDEAQNIKKAIQPALDMQAPFELVGSKTIHKLGHIVYMETSGVPFFDEEGNFKGYRGIDRDISERKKSQDMLRIQRDFAQELSTKTNLAETLEFCLDTALRSSGMDSGGIYLLDTSTGGLELACHKGLSQQFIADVSIFDKDAPNTKLVMAKSPVYAPYQPEYSDQLDSVRKVEGLRALSVIPITHKGEVVACINVSSHTANDIASTARNTLEAIAAQIGGVISRLRIQDALQTSEAKYRTLFESAEDAIFLMDGDRFIDCNSQTLKLYGCKREEIIGQPPYRFSPQTQPDGRDSKEKALHKINTALAGEPQRFYWKHIKLDGTPFDAEVALNRMEIAGKPLLQAIVRDITERRLAEEGLRKSEQRLSLHVMQTPLGVIEWNLDFEVVSWNPAAVEIFGFTEKEALGQHAADIIVPASAREHVNEIWQALLAKKGGERSTNENVTKDGKTILCEWYNTPLVDSRGKVIGVASLVQDVTERDRAQKEIAESRRKLAEINQMLKLVLDTIPVRIFWKDRNSRYLGCNKLFALDSGFNEPSDLIGKTDYDMGWREQAELYRSDDALVINTGQDKLNYEEPQTTPDGKRLWLRTSKVPLRDIDREIIGVLGTYEDITESKKVEEALRESEEKFRGIAESAQDIIFSLDLSGKVTYISPSMKDVMGEDPEEFIGTTFAQSGSISPLVKKAFDHHFNQLLIGESEPLFEIDLKTHDGDIRTLEFAARKLSNTIVGVARDVTSRKRSEQKIKDALIEKELLLKEIHHRVKNNLQVISSLLSLQAGYIKDQETLGIFNESQNRVKSMALIHEKLYQSEDMSSIDFKEYVSSLASSLFSSWGIDPSRISLQARIEDISLDINTAIPLALIINELLTNSLKHAFPDNASGRIILELASLGGNKYKLVVADDGKGFPPDIDFHKAKTLGLRLLNMLADQIGALIHLERQDGTVFTITFSINKGEVI